MIKIIVLSYVLYQMAGLVPSSYTWMSYTLYLQASECKVAPENIIQLNSIRIVLNHIGP